MQLAQRGRIELYVARNGFDFQATTGIPQLFHIATDGIDADLGAGEFQANNIPDTCHRQISGRGGEHAAVTADPTILDVGPRAALYAVIGVTACGAKCECCV